MSLGQINGQRSLQAKWKEVLGLGEKLLRQIRQAVSYAQPVHTSLKILQNLIVEGAERLVQGQAVLWLGEEVLHSLDGATQPVATPGFPNDINASSFSTLMRQVLQTHQAFCGPDSQSGPYGLVAEVESLGGALAFAAPLIAAGDESQAAGLLGILQVERTQGPPFEAQEIELLEGLAAQTAFALQAGLQMVKESWRLEQLSLVRQVSAQIANVRDLDELSRRVTSLIQQTFNYYYVAIFTLEPGQEVLNFRASAGLKRAGGALQSMIVHLGQGLIGHVAQTGEEILANDVRREPLYRHIDALPETLSEVALPLTIEDRMLGVLDVQSDQPGDFDETDMLVLHALAGTIAFAVEGARLYSALQQRADQLSAIQEVSNAITSILDQEQLLNEVVNLVQKRFGYPFVHLFTVHTGQSKIFYEAGTGDHAPISPEQGYDLDLDDPEGIIPWVARNGETVLANDVTQEPRYRPSALPPDETLAELTVPLIFGGQVLGVLDVQSDRLNAFGEEDRSLFEALAHNIAIAMRNANLYRSEVWRRQVADSLHEVAGLLSADIDLDQVLEAILAELERTLPLDMAAIWLLDEDADVEERDSIPPLHLAAVRGACLNDLELEIGLTPEDVLELNPSSTLELAQEHASDWLVQALRSPVPVIRSPESPYDPLGGALGFPSDYSTIAAPLRAGEQSLGVLTLAHGLPGRYGSEAHTMTATFASYAAVAIENARLYEAAHEQAWVSTVLLQVAEATQSQTNLNELLNTVIRITPMLVGVKACLLYIVDDETFVPAAASGLTTEQQVEFERWRFAPGDVSALDEMLIERRPVILHGESEDLRLTSILMAGEQGGISLHSELLALMPLLAHGEVLGAFLIDYSAPHDNQDLEAFFDERLSIIQGIAHQTAVAVENIRLVKSQKEEAYVSVALLQVAQAVVSSNNLDEALGAIVRITPILVGVQRAAIFVWDQELAHFRLSQAYGLPRNVEGCTYAPGDFPLLDAVRHWDNLLPQTMESTTDIQDDILEAWSLLMPPELDEVDEILENAACLLLAFPLSVKGEVLGVLLVEEPETEPGESFNLSQTNLRLRDKRLEIITGISQQAALAIQSELFRFEMVKRERLERELQLAREIQRAFLPHTLPDLPGWDLKVLWRTAREVGGDFYDFIELPSNRLGLVIADVADKGMPAALFMTLVRTLMRATALQVSSPARVLERVNDILVPDSPQGMYVTLAYAVLSVDTGELEYAIAGHNPPLLLRYRNCELKRLSRGGMALGVQEGNRIQSRRVTLEPGDYLILYTDGITEAFSPEGDMYGEERLSSIIRNYAACSLPGSDPTATSAQDVLEVIDRSVVDFVGNVNLGDDLTLVVLKRLH